MQKFDSISYRVRSPPLYGEFGADFSKTLKMLFFFFHGVSLIKFTAESKGIFFKGAKISHKFL